MNQQRLCRTGALLLILGLCLGSCRSSFDSPADLSRETGTLTVRLSPAEEADLSASGRTLAPQALSGQYVRLSFTPASGEAEPVEAETSQESFIVRLAAGTWNIQALGWQSKGDYETAPDAAILKGLGQVTVKAAEVLNTQVLLYPLGTGTGILSYTLTVPADTVSALLRVYALPETAASPAVLLDLYAGKEEGPGGTLNLQGSLSLAGGFYRGALDISRGSAGMLRKNDTIHIYDGLSTPAAYTFAAEDFSPGASFSDLAALKTYLDAQPENSPDTPYLITLTGFSGDLFTALSRYAALDLRGYTGKTLTTGSGGSENRSKLVSLILPEGMEALGNNALSGCTSLEYLILPQALKTIGDSALKGIGVSSLSIPGGVVFRHDCNCGMTCFIMGDIETKVEGIYATEEIQGNTHEG
jgi:hypothetical protein